MPLDRMRVTEGRDKAIIAGFCESSRHLTVYDDPSYYVVGLNRAYIWQKRADAWFDMHSPAIRNWYHRRDKDHARWMRSFPGPIYMHEVDPDIPNSVRYPIEEVQEDIGVGLWRLIGSGEGGPMGASSGGGTVQHGARKHVTANDLERKQATDTPYFDSSIAYEIALAIHEGFKEIMVVGVDLNTQGEYVWQRSGVSYLLGLAQGRGITVVLPDNCPLLQGNCYGRAFLMPGGEHMSQAQLETRLEALYEEMRIKVEAAAEMRGRTVQAEALAQQMIPGIDQEKLHGHVKQLKAMTQQAALEVKATEGAVKETLYWIHQTPDGDPPSQRAHELDQRVNGYHTLKDEQLSEGDLSTFAEINQPAELAGVN